MMHEKEKAFTLVEIMIVVAIIGLLVSIAIPSLLRARLSANETSAKASLRAIIVALENYRASCEPPTYPESLEGLSDANPPFIDPFPTGGRKHGYTYTYIVADAITINVASGEINIYPGYIMTAVPVSDGFSGNAKFFVNPSGIIYADQKDPYEDPPAEYTVEVPEGYLAIGG
jgi:type IV pilus assembly protein PilA